ncbi:MAG: bifunctional aspartate kinase/homoserine dehydrogenase I [Myxococcota bacterium]
MSPETPRSPWVVHKFGGTSVADAGRYRQVGDILQREDARPVAVVVSAMAKVTDALIDLTERAKARDESLHTRLDALRARHRDTAQALVPGPACTELLGIIDSDFRDLADVLKAIWLSRSCSELVMELCAGLGEVWSAQLLDAHLRSQGQRSRFCDARRVLVVRPGDGIPLVDWDTSRQRLRAWIAEHPADVLVVTGYVASTPDGVATTLKRNGSDYSASIFAALLDARAVTIWTDVDGIMSADPRRVPDAVVLSEMSYQEAIELAYFGAKVVHPHTMAPAMARDIPIWIRNTFNPTARGTCIHHASVDVRSDHGAPVVKGFSTIDHVALIDVEGTGMMGVPGIASRLFGALRDVGVSVTMISQASSEHSICLAVPQGQAELAKQTIEQAFFSELRQGHIESVDVLAECAILAAVGDNMVHSLGVAARFFGALAKAQVNVRAIAQGSSERNISAVIAAQDSTRALRAVHSGFFLSDQTLSVGVIGTGLVGQAFLRQLAAQVGALHAERKIDLRVRALMNGHHMYLSEAALSLDDWQAQLTRHATTPELEAFVRHVQAPHLPHCVIVDCTASAEVASHYADWLTRGIHVVTPNKKANAGELGYYQALRRAARDKRRHYLYEATVGAGLPVISTLRDLISTGDRIESIEGVLSGTLSFVFNSLTVGRRFSHIIAEARSLGYTEPDPRDDLSGLDFARKLVILGREMGLPINVGDVTIDSLLPEALKQITAVEDFMQRLGELDDAMEARVRAAAANDEVLRYVGVVDASGGARVELRATARQHPFARITGTDNIIAFRTARYHDHPLLVQGPGAGPEVTAAGVFADLLRVAAYLGAPT